MAGEVFSLNPYQIELGVSFLGSKFEPVTQPLLTEEEVKMRSSLIAALADEQFLSNPIRITPQIDRQLTDYNWDVFVKNVSTITDEHKASLVMQFSPNFTSDDFSTPHKSFEVIDQCPELKSIIGAYCLKPSANIDGRDIQGFLRAFPHAWAFYGAREFLLEEAQWELSGTIDQNGEEIWSRAVRSGDLVSEEEITYAMYSLYLTP